MSRFIDNILSGLNSTSGRKSYDLEMSKPCYTLFIHNEDDEINDLDVDDDLEEPTAFQVPVDMKWNDLQDLIFTEVKSPTKLNFTYRDDENDVIRIDSQDEYETALSLCRDMNRDLHIYAEKPNKHHRHKRHHRQHKRRTEEENRAQDQDKSEEDEVEILRPPTEENPAVVERVPSPEPTVTFEPLPAVSPEELGAASAPPPQENGEESLETPISSLESNENYHESQETKPMSAENSILNVIRKEVREVVSTELDDIWRFVNALKRDINNELDVIGEQLNAQGRHQVQQHQNQTDISQDEEKQESEPTEASAQDTTDEHENQEDETDKFAATFICESLLDGSIVRTCESYEKHWVFRNDGNAVWDENTKLHLLDETCDPPVATGSSLSEWGAKSKSVRVPPLKHGESGVVCAEHIAPAHACNYNSSWRLSHSNNPFGPRVWCNVRVVDETGSPVDNHAFESVKNHGSYEMVLDEQSQKKSLEQSETKSLEQSLVPPEKVSIELAASKHDDGLHNDNSIRSFDMHDISDGAKYIETTGHESATYNPAVTSVENKEEECLHGEENEENQQEENEGASVDSEGTSSPVMVSPNPEASTEMEAPAFTHDATNVDEEPRTLENEEDSDGGEDLYSSKIILDNDDHEENHVENFTEPPMRMNEDSEPSSDEEEEEEEDAVEEDQTDQPEPEVKDDHRDNSSDHEDLHSVDFNLVDDNMSMTSYDVSDFVVVPLPDCFDVNRPLNVSEHEETKEAKPAVQETDQPSSTVSEVSQAEEADQDESLKEEVVVEEEEDEENKPTAPPSDHETSDSEIESQPASTTFIKEYKSEDSLPLAPKSPPSGRKSPPPAPKPDPQPVVVTHAPKVNLAPTFLPPDNDPPIDYDDNAGPDSVDNESLTERITKEFDAFLSNPDHPIEPQPKPKIPMNQMPTKSTPAPQPVPQSVLNQDQPYNFGQAEAPYFPPFDQGWRRNPIPIPPSVTDDTPWPQPVQRLPRSEFTLNRNSNGIESTLPSQPFAVASPSENLTSEDLQAATGPQRRRSPSPQIELADDFFPPDLDRSDFHINENNGEPDIFRTPPGSPAPRDPSIQLTPLDQLYEMGFHDLELNMTIFEQCGQDLNRTVQALVLRQLADEDMMA